MDSDRATILSLLPIEEIDEENLRKLLGVGSLIIIPSVKVKAKSRTAGFKYISKTHRESGAGVFAIFCRDWERQPSRTALFSLACMVKSLRSCAVDQKGIVHPLTWSGLFTSELPSAFSQYIAGQQLAGNIDRKVTEGLSGFIPRHPTARGSVNKIVYLRTDLWLGIRVGGSIGHVAGVINGYVRRGIKVDVISSERPLLIDDSVRLILIEPGNFYRNVWEHVLLYYNQQVLSDIERIVGDRAPDAVFARYALDSYAPAILSRKLGIPLIIEYNGSEVWVARHWGSKLRYPDLSLKIEESVLKSADMVTVVSKPLKDELVGRGIDERRILVNPNSVDPDMFDPGRFSQMEMENLKSELGIPDGTIVAGFIGTFGPWHGVDVLAKAIPLALKDNSRLHFMLIGDGQLLDSVKDQLRTSDVLDRVTFTGVIPQEDAPRYLMCADFFLSPHVPNPDGTPFFGSPTKLFEYMALGKGIIASDLEQLGEILEHGKTAILVKPGDAKDLASAIDYLYDNMDIADRLGKAARERVLENHTWDAHVGNILDHLYSLK